MITPALNTAKVLRLLKPSMAHPRRTAADFIVLSYLWRLACRINPCYANPGEE